MVLKQWQIEFCGLVAGNHNGTQAMKDCGHEVKAPCQTASQLLKKEEIKVCIDRLRRGLTPEKKPCGCPKGFKYDEDKIKGRKPKGFKHEPGEGGGRLPTLPESLKEDKIVEYRKGVNLKYNEDMPANLINYFVDRPIYEEHKTYNKDGNWIRTNRTAEPLPTMMDFCRDYGISHHTVYDWVEKYPQFKQAKDTVDKLRERYLVVNALLGLINSQFAMFALKNKHGWRDVSTLDDITDKESPTLEDIAAIEDKLGLR